MKVYTCPDELPAPELDFKNFDWEKHDQAEREHSKKLAEWLRNRGYTGKHTGKIVRFGVADGYAQYMLADAPRASALIHLPYGDAYQYRDVSYLPKKEIIARVESEEKFNALFHKNA